MPGSRGKIMRLGIRNSVRLIEALCRMSCASRQPLCLNSTIVDQLSLPLLTNSAWNSIVAGLSRRDIECFEQQVFTGNKIVVTGFIIWRRGVRLNSPKAVENVIRIISSPAVNYPRYSVSSGDIKLGMGRDAIEQELDILRVAAEILIGSHRAALLDCVNETERQLSALNTLEEQEMKKIGFEEACESIKSIASMPFDLDECEHAQRVRVHDLMKGMLSIGFPKTRARRLIAEATEIPSYTIRQWTKYPTSEVSPAESTVI
jgi:hypothetical protein